MSAEAYAGISAAGSRNLGSGIGSVLGEIEDRNIGEFRAIIAFYTFKPLTKVVKVYLHQKLGPRVESHHWKSPHWQSDRGSLAPRHHTHLKIPKTSRYLSMIRKQIVKKHQFEVIFRLDEPRSLI
jgi:hypothetical protein